MRQWMRAGQAAVMAVMAAALLSPGVYAAGAEILPRPSYANSFCLFPIDESWHVRTPADAAKLTRVIQQMRSTLGPDRLYAHLGIAIISDGNEPATYALARRLGIGLVLQGGAIEHHSAAWGFPDLLHDPVKGDRRFAQWFQDGKIADPGKANDFAFGVRACSSCYARPVYELRREREKARDQQIAQAFKAFPDTVLACSGPIECEMSQGDNRWGDYSPFTIAEFRDYLTHRGIYAPGRERHGLGYPGGQRFARDPSPAVALPGHPSFNRTFGTDFTTWTLRYWDPSRFPARVPLDANGMPGVGQTGFVAGGFDAPRDWPGEPHPASIRPEANALFWDAWSGVSVSHPGFRSMLLNFWVSDHTRWLAEAGVPRDRVFSHQIPGESYGMGRLSRGASAVWTASTPHGSIGITTYFGAASDAAEFEKIVSLNPNWGIFEYHPHPIDALKAPVSEYLHSLNTCIRFRAHILTPIAWPEHGKDFVVSVGPFATAMKQVMASLPDQPYYNRSYVDYTPPPITGLRFRREGAGTLVTWSPRIWSDLRFRWTDWHEFNHFIVRGPAGRVLASTRDYQAEVNAPPSGITVTAVKRAAPPHLPRITGLAGHGGRLRWNECSDFFCDHYRIDLFSSAAAITPIRTATTREAAFDSGPMGDRQEVWARVSACEASGAHGPYTARFQLSLPRAGRRLVDFASLRPVVTNSPDTSWRDTAVGGIPQPGLFEHPPLTGGGWAKAEFRFRLPKVARGQRILFLAENGIGDSSGKSDGVIFRLEVNGVQQFQRLILQDRRWRPMQVDLTADAGKNIRLTLMTNPNQNSASDWAVWGGPEVLLVGAGVTERPVVTGIVALGKEVRGQVTLQWQNRASNGKSWKQIPAFVAFRVYRGADRSSRDSGDRAGWRRLGETRTDQFVDRTFDGRETYYWITALFKDGTESPPSEAVQYAP